jgi:ABC-type multidrug transport system fused ATPase/permease subunit
LIRRKLSFKQEKEKRDTLEMQPVSSQDKHSHGLSPIFPNEMTNTVGLEVKFNNINYRVDSGGKLILSEITGTAKKASLLGIMGPSGSGKCEHL